MPKEDTLTERCPSYSYRGEIKRLAAPDSLYRQTRAFKSTLFSFTLWPKFSFRSSTCVQLWLTCTCTWAIFCDHFSSFWRENVALFSVNPLHLFDNCICFWHHWCIFELFFYHKKNPPQTKKTKNTLFPIIRIKSDRAAQRKVGPYFTVFHIIYVKF